MEKQFYFYSKFTQNFNSNPYFFYFRTNTTQWNSEDERIGTLSFVILDKNKNKSWERKEWKTFRELVTNNK